MKPSHINKNPLFTEIENKIFIKKNFISEKEYNNLLVCVKNLSEKDWNTHPTDINEDGKISINLQETLPVSQEIIESIIPKYWINEHKTVNRMNITHEPHKFGWDSWTAADYVAVFYFGEFQGGNLKCFEPNGSDKYSLIKIETNTLYLLPIKDGERYQSEKVTFGDKYTFVDWVYRHAEWAIP